MACTHMMLGLAKDVMRVEAQIIEKIQERVTSVTKDFLGMCNLRVIKWLVQSKKYFGCFNGAN